MLRSLLSLSMMLFVFATAIGNDAMHRIDTTNTTLLSNDNGVINLKNEKGELRWETLPESSISVFVLQAANTVTEWENVEEVEAYPLSNFKHKYSVDLPEQHGTYRLKMVNTNGEVSYTTPISMLSAR
ncbi:hypothetical protein [Flammeovirga sp. SubArs3]|uniref:hypothetical protein n=1 Tax=Flammeovirga sp. SubArs3 TaxID=2995316 RepID=UPI00248B6B9F|nr:hypothetical protein [Flammeovirga sp. SubArs3]